MNKVFLWSALFCTVLGLAACGSGSNLAHNLDKLPGKAMLLTEAKERDITLEAMETLYPSGLPLFGDSVPAGYMQAWTGFFQGLVGEMRKSGMEWSEPYRFWGRAYFAPGGTVDHFFYQWAGKAGGNPSEEWDGQFRAVLERYLDTFCFEYPMKGRFAQCGSVVLKPAE